MQQKPQTAKQAPVRVRFAPSNTGYLHVGGARTALFNWLFARKMRGLFVLRIEDTDAERSREEFLEDILQGLRWLGLQWDEGPEVGGPYGPYRQTLRQVLYHAEADRLIREGKAYRCFCTREEIEAMREAARRSGAPPRYDRRCRRRDPVQSAELAESGHASVVRLRMPEEGEVGWVDLVRGEFHFKYSVLDDFVLLKSDGNPTYNFGAVVDDVKMSISHVIRGDDHISNTPRQLALFDALGYARPEFAHLPMILGADKTRLSKRHGATALTQFRDAGILPAAMMNYLALLGWSFDGEREMFTPSELVTHFSLKNVSRTPAVFDAQKLLWMNREHFSRLGMGAKLEVLLPEMRRHGMWPPRFRVDLGPTRHFRVVTGSPDDKVAASIQPVSEEEWLHGEPTLAEELPRLKLILEALGNRLGGPNDVAEVLGYFYTDDFPYDPDAVAKNLASDEVAANLKLLADELEGLPTWTPEAIEAALRKLAARRGTKAGFLIHPARAALTGRAGGPGIFDLFYLLGRSKSLERLRRGHDIVKFNRALPAAEAPALLAPAGSPGSEPRGEPPLESPTPGLRPPKAPPGLEPAGDIELAGSDWPEDDAPEET